MKKIRISKGMYTIVDDEDFEFLSQFRWCARGRNDRYYARCYQRNVPRGIGMHKMLLNPPPGFGVDHINRDTLDNRRSNLRIATVGQNNFNKWTKKKFKGVFWRKDKNRWAATIGANRKTYHLGYFKSDIDAALAYDEAARNLHGEFAYLNFPVYPSRSTNMYF